LRASEAVDLQSYLKEANLGNVFEQSIKSRLEQENLFNQVPVDTGIPSNAMTLGDLARRDFG
jgi:hypothetical protein